MPGVEDSSLILKSKQAGIGSWRNINLKISYGLDRCKCIYFSDTIKLQLT